VVLRKTGEQTVTGSTVVSGSAGDDLALECVASGGNPAPSLQWRLRGEEVMAREVQQDRRGADGRWESVSRLVLPVSREDNRGEVECVVTHPALDSDITESVTLNIFFPPVVKVRSNLPTEGNRLLLAEGDSVTLTCEAESNPPASLRWHRVGRTPEFQGSASSLPLGPANRGTAGSYQCTAENELGLSQPQTIVVEVEFGPVIQSVSPQARVEAIAGEELLLRCSATASPPPNYQWLQQTSSGEVRVLGYESTLRIQAISYEHQGEFVCKAANTVGGERREVQSKPIEVAVRGRPRISSFRTGGEVQQSELVVKTGEDANIEVQFCANPRPKQTWDIGPVGGDGKATVLNDRTRYGRFVVDNLVDANMRDCYVATLRILGVHPSDSRAYPLELANEHGIDEYSVTLVVIDTAVSQEIFIAIVVGGILTILLFSLIIIYMVKADKCCAGEAPTKLNVEPDQVDVESCHSSTVSGHTDKTVIPPDALYGTAEKKKLPFSEHIFNDSAERLRPDLLSATTSRSGSPSQPGPNTYNELCFPKASNCGSMKRKKQRDQGVECQLANSTYGYINYLNPEQANMPRPCIDNRLYE
jgi:hypothetical protein